MNYVSLALRTVIAFILLQSLYFKFTGHPEAVHIFSTIGMEPWGRYFVGTSELIVSILLFVPRLKLHGMLGVAGLMTGAIGFHLFTPLGIVVRWDGQSDGGMLFAMAVIALVLSLILLALHAPRSPRALMRELLLKKN